MEESREQFDNYCNPIRGKIPRSTLTVGKEVWIEGELYQVKDISPFGIKLKFVKSNK